MRLKTILDDHFSGKQVNKNDLRLVDDYRSESIRRALNSLLYLHGGLNPSKIKPHYAGKEFDEVLESENYASFFSEQMVGQRVIELGPGLFPRANILFERFSIGEYVGVELINPEWTESKLDLEDSRISVVKDDALSYFMSQPDNSAIIVSRGVICPELIQLDGDEDNIDYFRFLGKELYRVTPIGSLNVHGTGLCSNQIDKVFIENGFKPFGFYDKNVFVKS